MAGLDPAIHDFVAAKKTWMPGTRPGMTKQRAGLKRQKRRERKPFAPFLFNSGNRRFGSLLDQMVLAGQLDRNSDGEYHLIKK